MKFVSTRGKSPAVTFTEAMSAGLAPDGGLYVPDDFAIGEISQLDASGDYAEFASELLEPYFRDAFDFPIPLRVRPDGLGVLELFHGPTAAFKDVGARFLAECIVRTDSDRPRTVVVATSGDTGGAVAAAFFGKPDVEVFVLYPKGRISNRQEKQIACWRGNVRALAVEGTFDDCQRIVKEALRDRDLVSRRKFVSANSINVARLLAQVTYYAKSTSEYWQKTGETPGVIVPSGNLGNAFAALWAKRLGFPVGTVVLATNANRTISDFFESGDYRPRATIATLANAMDVGDPSNMERLRWLYPSAEDLRDEVKAISVSDPEIQRTIRESFANEGEMWCPHTATAIFAKNRLGGSNWIVVSTAHPAKFEGIVEPLVGRTVEVPPKLAVLLDREARFTSLGPSLEAFKEFERSLLVR
jgi:threonine synthase